MKETVPANDLKIEQLPNTRWKVFLDLLKNRKRDMTKLSMLLFVFLLPLVVDILIFNQYILLASYNEDAAVAASTVFSLILYMMIISIPCVIIGFIGLGGLCYSLKNIVWQEGSIIGPDFFTGIKKNFKHSILFGLVWSLSLFLVVVGSIFLLRTRADSDMPWVHSVGVGLCIVQFIVLSIICVYALNYTVYYQNSFREVFKNSMIFFTAKFFKNLLLFAVTTGLIVGLMFVDFIAQIVVIVLIAFISSFMMVGWTLLSHSAFDQYINKENYPDYYKKGLYQVIPNKEE